MSLQISINSRSLHSTWRRERTAATGTASCSLGGGGGGGGGVATAAASSDPALLRLLVPLLLLLVLLLFPAPVVVGLTTDGVHLLSFKYAVLADPLAVLSSWNYDDPTPCAWNGVACAAVPSDPTASYYSSRVISLVLPNARLLGSLAPDLGLLEHLRHLDLSGNSLNGTLPDTLFSAASNGSSGGNATAAAANATAFPSSELRVLSLGGNEISGKIPDLAAGYLTKLQVVNLSDNALTGRIPAGFALLPNLTLLSLSNNYLSGGLPEAGGGGGFGSAEFVDLSSNLLNGTLPPDFAPGGNLRYLNLSYNRLAGEIPRGFAAKTPAGSAVDLSFNNLTGAIPDSGPLLDQKPKAFAGNPDLCGKPLKILCPIPSTLSDPPSDAAGTPPAAATGTRGTTTKSPPAFAAIPKTVDGGSPSGGAQQSSRHGGLRKAVIVGIIAGDLGGVGLLFMIFLYVYHAKKKRRQQQQQGIGPHKAENLAVKQKQHQWPTSTSATSQTRHTSGSGIFFCLGKKAAGDDSEETSETTGSDTEAEDGGGKGEEKMKSPKVQPPQPSGLLVTVDGETELELETLLKASAYILGATGSGIVYKAVIADGTAFAVRRIGDTGGGGSDKLKDFEAQVQAIAKLRHPNLAAVRGFYWGSDENLLISDYAPNGSLAHISYKKLGSSPYHLSWDSRLRIARGVARGLTYLHEKKCVHGNVKPSNILLGPDMEPWIGDFGLDRLTSGDGAGKLGFSARHFGSKRSTLSQNSQQETPAPAPSTGTSPYGTSSSAASPYHAPESLKNLKPSSKWDVYSFGVVLLELLAGSVIPEAELGQWSAAAWCAAEERNRVLRMADPTLRGEVEGNEEALLSCFRLGLGCTSVAPQRRPSMKDALQVLDRIPSSSFPSFTSSSSSLAAA